jgi:hypothetical protein
MAFAAANVFLLGSVAIELTLFYRMWAAIQNSSASISPAKAVAFLFIPVFNIYWALLMITGFADECNSLVRRSPVKVKELPLLISTAYAFMFLLSCVFITIPLVCVLIQPNLISRAFGFLLELSWVLVFFAAAVGIAHFVLYTLFALKTCTAINALRAQR